MSDVLNTPRPEDRFGDIVARLEVAQKSNRGTPVYTRWVNRRVGRYLAALAFVRNWTPNQLTAASAALSYGGILSLALVRPTWWTGVVIALALAAGFALDAADGQLARLRGGGSAAGEWLDHVVDAVKTSSIHVAVLICWYRFYDLSSDGVLLIPIVFGIQSTVFYFAIMLAEQLRRSAIGLSASSAPVQHESTPVLRSLIVAPNDYGLLCWSFALVRFERPFTWIYGTLMAINVVFLFGGLGKWHRDMRAIDGGRHH